MSGNPAGRPRKDNRIAALPSTSTAVLAELDRQITVVENGVERKITGREALILAQLKSALRGNSYAQERMLVRDEKAERELAKIIADENEGASEYIDSCRRAIETARAKGLPDPEFYPHPEDIVIEPGRPYRIEGPATKEAAAAFNRACEMRDLFIKQSMLSRPGDDGQICAELLLAFSIDNRPPRRMRLDDAARLCIIVSGSRVPRRELALQVQLAWRSEGARTRCGFTYPKLDRDLLLRRLDEAVERAARQSE